jgi:hypothetical protein
MQTGEVEATNHILNQRRNEFLGWLEACLETPIQIAAHLLPGFVYEQFKVITTILQAVLQDSVV